MLVVVSVAVIVGMAALTGWWVRLELEAADRDELREWEAQQHAHDRLGL